jgi:glycogen synthase
MRKVPKVLMLGWEFPPVINGGLGVACHDLSTAMSAYADVTMIIPKSTPGFKVKNLNLIGLNTIDAKRVDRLSKSYTNRFFSNVYSIPADLDPYYMEESTMEFTSTLHQVRESRLKPFQIDNLYGGNVVEKVVHFSNLAAALATEMEFDVIHAHDWMTMLAGMKIKAQSGKPLVVHVHSLEVDRGGECSRGWVYDMEKSGLEYADLILPVSRFTGENVHKYYDIPREKIFAVHNGISPVHAFRSPRNYDEKTVLFIGRLTRQKGPEFFLDIASRVLEKDSNVRFVMAGTGDHFNRLLEDSAYKHIGHRFHLTGFLNLEQIRNLLSISDVYCMPSVSEPFGLSAVEAAQFGVPCVISRQSGVSEVLSGSLKFDFWDSQRAAEYILSLLNDPVLRDKVVEDANANLENISWDLSAQKVMQAYREHQVYLN